MPFSHLGHFDFFHKAESHTKTIKQRRAASEARNASTTDAKPVAMMFDGSL